MNRHQLDEMRREIFRVIQKNASWMSTEEFIELSRNVGEALEASQKKVLPK